MFGRILGARHSAKLDPVVSRNDLSVPVEALDNSKPLVKIVASLIERHRETEPWMA